MESTLDAFSGEDSTHMQMKNIQAFIFLSLVPLCTSTLLAAKSAHLQHWNLVGDFVYMRRTEIHDQQLVKDSKKYQCPNLCPNYTVIDSEDLVHNFDFEPGYRVGITFTPSEKNSIEANFMYLTPWEGHKRVHGDKSLSFPFKKSDYDLDFTDASKAIAKYTSQFWDAELNYWRNISPRLATYFGLSGIAGFRYFHLNESFKLIMIKPPDRSTYNIHTDNNLYALQIGLDFQMNPTHWLSWEAFGKVGLFANDANERQFLGDLDNTVTVRNARDSEVQWGFFTDVAAQVSFRFLHDHLNIHGGYQMMFFTGLSLAPEQVSRSVDRDAGGHDRTHGSAIIHGLFAGIGVRF